MQIMNETHIDKNSKNLQIDVYPHKIRRDRGKEKKYLKLEGTNHSKSSV